MLSKFNLISIFLLFYCSSVYAIDRYNIGDTLHVWAVSGLVLREAPNATAKKILTIQYGVQVITQQSKYGIAQQHSVRIQEEESWPIEGSPNRRLDFQAVYLFADWVKVEYKGQQGYLFDGYLSHWPAIRFQFRSVTHWGKKYQLTEPEPLRTYLERNFKLLDSMEIHYENSRYDPIESQKRLVFETGIIQEVRIYEKSGEEELVFPGMSKEEAFLLLNIIHHLDHSLQTKEKESMLRVQSWDEQGFMLGMPFQESGCDTMVRIIGRMCVITTGCSC